MATSETRVGVIGALPEEVSRFSRNLEDREMVSLHGRKFTTGKWEEQPVVVTHTGPGPKNARQGVELLLGEFTIDHLLVAGVCGALSPGLKRFEIVASSIDEDWIASVTADRKYKKGTIATVPRMLLTARDKQRHWENLGKPENAVVDMETSVFEEVADRVGVPCLAIRVVLDEAGEDLPVILSDGENSDGDFDRGKLIRRVLLRPGAIPALIRMGTRLAKCSRVLEVVIPKSIDFDEVGA